MMFQSLMAIPLIYEIPYILQFLKPLRFISLFSGIAYNIMYWFNFFDVLYICFAVATPPEKVSMETVDEVVNPNGVEVVGEVVPDDTLTTEQ